MLTLRIDRFFNFYIMFFHTIRALLLFVLLGIRIHASESSGIEFWPNNPEIAKAELDIQWTQIQKPSSGVGIRGVFRFALEGSAIGYDSYRIEQALILARSMQDLDQRSPTFGNFRWRYGQDKVNDQNAVQFAMTQASILHLFFSDKLSKKSTSVLRQMMVDAVVAVKQQKVDINYTNIYIKRAWNLMGLGYALNDPSISEFGYKHFDAWINHISKHGIAEYGAVVYYGIDLDVLALINRFSRNENSRLQAATAINFLWVDIAANWWNKGDRFGGVNSRSYDYLFGRGYLEAHTWPAGWLREKPTLEGAGWLSGPRTNLTFLLNLVTRKPPLIAETIRSQLPRTVVQRWGSNITERSIHHVDADFSIASSGSTARRDERTLVANLGDDPSVPQIVMFMDGVNNPYGVRKSVGKQGARKALHLLPFITTVQKGSELIQVLSDDLRTRNPNDPRGSLRTQLLLPTLAEVYNGDQVLVPGNLEKPVSIKVGDTIFIRMSGGALALRFLVATKPDGDLAPIEFIRDAEGKSAMRITVVHSDDAPTGRATTAVWIKAAGGLSDSVDFAKWRSQMQNVSINTTMNGNTLTIHSSHSDSELKIVTDLKSEQRLEIIGGEAEALLSVNGYDYGSDILQNAPTSTDQR
jgi:hypothetical protein